MRELVAAGARAVPFHAQMERQGRPRAGAPHFRADLVPELQVHLAHAACGPVFDAEEEGVRLRQPRRQQVHALHRHAEFQGDLEEGAGGQLRGFDADQDGVLEQALARHLERIFATVGHAEFLDAPPSGGQSLRCPKITGFANY